ncbi:hypothetical protein [uncultured Ilyobacter sp.]|uniref:hypothetical protein n=1 Tax=uncultured Ilyobacter sp. TaxID=544433 RepID=UPI0029C992C4|nr:hypothetical protein [uncultured Ilyobacter sp.]
MKIFEFIKELILHPITQVMSTIVSFTVGILALNYYRYFIPIYKFKVLKAMKFESKCIVLEIELDNPTFNFVQVKRLRLIFKKNSLAPASQFEDLFNRKQFRTIPSGVKDKEYSIYENKRAAYYRNFMKTYKVTDDTVLNLDDGSTITFHIILPLSENIRLSKSKLRLEMTRGSINIPLKNIHFSEV